MAFYMSLLKGAFHIAVDGGIRFFLKNKLRPDILIGDFDSAPRMSQKYLSSIEVIRHPEHKDKTDSQLALELALERGAECIDICGGITADEIDHTLGNIFLLDLVNKYNKRHGCRVIARLIGPNNIVYLLHNNSIALKARRDDCLSVIPLSESVKLDFNGLSYPPPAKPLKFGDSLTLRNKFKNARCHIDIHGKAIVVIVPAS